ncbi:hypothetical protein EDD85DRAFT_796654 [Armillaria nabsnona]|nr:hypothetical protein EDD85DRAFT_796654 [Armillaria nabsnona]
MNCANEPHNISLKATTRSKERTQSQKHHESVSILKLDDETSRYHNTSSRTNSPVIIAATSKEKVLDSQNGENELKVIGSQQLTTLHTIGDERAPNKGHRFQAGEEKILSRKIRRTLEKERKTTDKEKPASSEFAKAEQVQLLPNGTIIEHPQSLKLETMTPKHTSRTAVTNQVNQNIKLRTSLNHVPSYIISVPTKSPDLTSTYVDLLGHSKLSWPPESARIVVHQEPDTHALTFTVERTSQYSQST